MFEGKFVNREVGYLSCCLQVPNNCSALTRFLQHLDKFSELYRDAYLMLMFVYLFLGSWTL